MSNDDPNFSASSEYAFPRLAGVEHDSRITAQMSYSKLPSSPEFEAIDWTELRITLGAPPGIETPASNVPIPALIAYYDFDNDGESDTVLKYGFTEGYMALRYGASEEYVMVWRGESVPASVGMSLWQLRNEDPWAESHVPWGGTYIRPFVFDGRSYVALYTMSLGETDTRPSGPYPIASETMDVRAFRYRGARNEFTGMPAWTTEVLCRYRMQQL